MLLSGVQVGNSVVVAWALSDLPTCTNRVANKEWPKISIGDMTKDVDRFYTNPTNIPLPISMAVVYTFLTFTGASKEKLEEFRLNAIQVYSRRTP
jgi:hypothetical protein